MPGEPPALPPVLRDLHRFGPDRCESLSVTDADAYTADLLAESVENFHVATRLLPRRLRKPFRHVYAFCRAADDLGDETHRLPDVQRAGKPADAARAKALDLLAWWRDELDRCFAGQPRHPIFVSLAETAALYDLPRGPFDDLLDAFVQDQTVPRYDTYDELLDYCDRSANPVGRLVLMLVGYRDAERFALSDATCTALQLANFWQDVRRDAIDRDRVYLPRAVAARHGLDVDTLAANLRAGRPVAVTDAYHHTLRDLTARATALFDRGRMLWPLVPRDAALDIRLFTLGGEAVLKKIRARDYDTLTERPRITKANKAALLTRALTTRVPTRHHPDAHVHNAYARCAGLTRRAARNFYLGMRLTPQPKRASLYALYAWMRAADDIADEPGDAQESSRRLAQFRASTQRAVSGDAPPHDFWPAVGDTFRTHAVPVDALLDQLAGQADDLADTTYHTLDDTLAYCRRVASTVGLACCAIWGTDRRVDPDLVRREATQRGIALQLTNILRDLREDAQRSRVYLPADRLAHHGVSAGQLASGEASPGTTALMHEMIDHARAAYADAAPLEQRLHPDGRASCAAMAAVYHALLDRIAADPAAALRRRVRVPTHQKAQLVRAAARAQR